MGKINVYVFVILYLGLNFTHQYPTPDSTTIQPDNHFDIIIFTQEWPVSVCKFWTYVLSPGAPCSYPSEKNQWAVHGIWPSNMGHTHPEFCNNSWPFDLKEIASLEHDLEEGWTNTYKGTEYYSLWKHEWDKHGTCSSNLDPINSQLKYFSKGIEWNKKYSLQDMLNVANIFPSDTKKFSPEDFVDAVKVQTKKDPMVECLTINGELYLLELRLCFDKEFSLIDCYVKITDNCSKIDSDGIIYAANA